MMEVRKITLEGDAMEVVQAFCREGVWRGSYGMVIEEARENLQQLLEWRVNHVPKQANESAHRLAKYALEINEDHVWVWGYPQCIHDLVLAEQGSD